MLWNDREEIGLTPRGKSKDQKRSRSSETPPGIPNPKAARIQIKANCDLNTSSYRRYAKRDTFTTASHTDLRLLL